MRFLPIFIFLGIFLGSGIYFHATGTAFAFYQISPTIAIVPAILFAITFYKKPFHEKINCFLDGMRHKDIIMMVIIFLLAGAFGSVTKTIGSIDATVQFCLHLLPQWALLGGLFLISSFVSLAIGSSMGVVAVVTPLAVGIAGQAGLPLPLSVGAVIGGAMFGDNLSFISDTTIAAVQTQQADLKKKFLFNAPISFISGAIVFCILLWVCEPSAKPIPQTLPYLTIMPYILIIGLALSGVHVFVVLTIGIMAAFLVGAFTLDYSIVTCAQDMYQGFLSMHEIIILSLFIGGLSELMRAEGCIAALLKKLEKMLLHQSQKMASLAIGMVAALVDVLVANNTIAIILSGDMVKQIARAHHISPHRAATWVDIFSCVFQGLIPYGAQILLASSIAGISPLSLVPTVHYCFVLAIVAIGFMLFGAPERDAAWDETDKKN